MSGPTRFVPLTGLLLIVLLASLVCPGAVSADDGIPPLPATEEPAQPLPAEDENGEAVPPDSGAESSVTAEQDQGSPLGAVGTESSPTDTSEDIVAAAPPQTESPAAAETPGETESSGSPGAQGEETAEEPAAADEVTVADILETAPEGTEVVVLDGNGAALPLVSEETAGVIDVVDPMWCPTGETPLNDSADGSVECRSFGTPQLLIDDMDAAPALYAQNGTIYFTADSGGAFLLNEDAIGLSLASWNALRIFDLTLQGGWNGDSAAGFAVDPVVGTVFNGGDGIEVGLGNPWIGDLTIQDITISGASDTGLWIFTQGNIDLENVTSNNPGELYGAYLVTTSGDIRVANSSFNLNSSDGLRTWAVNGSVILNDVTSTGNGGRGVQGQAGGTGGIRVTGGSFSNNGLDGMWLWSDSGDITLSGVTADDNGFDGAVLDTCIFAGGVCTGSGSIAVDSSIFSGNDANGIEADSNGDIILSGVTASNNWNGDGALLVTLANATVLHGVFQNNAGYGVNGSNVGGTFTLNDVIFGGNGAGDYAGSPVFASGGYEDVVRRGNGEALPLHIVPVNGGEQVELTCAAYSGTRLILPNGHRVTLLCPIREHGQLTGKAQAELPGPLDATNVFVSALEVAVFRDGQPVTMLAAGMTIDFVIPDDNQGQDLVILYWNASQSKWLEVAGGYMTADGRYTATSNATGIYALVSE